MSEKNGLPNGWAWTKIEDLCPPNRPVAYGVLQPGNDYPGGIPLVRVCDVSDGKIAVEQLKLIDPAISARYPRTLLRGGEILLTIVGTIGRTAVATDAAKGANTARAVAVLPVSHLAEPKFVELILRNASMRAFFTESAHEVARKTLNLEDVRATRIPLAPLNEQRRIVAKIEEVFSDLDAAVAALERIKANLKRYRASVLRAAVEGRLTEEWRAKHPKTEPASKLLERILAERRQKWEEDQLAKFAAANKTPPKGWREKYVDPAAPDTSQLPELPLGWTVASLEQLTDANRPICYGILMPKENVAEGVLYVKVKDMKGDRIDLASLHRTRREIAEEYSRASLKPGDLLLAIRGTYGRVANVPPELDGGNITQDTARLAITKEMNSEFVATALRSFDCQSYFKRVARGVAVKGVNIGDVKLCPIPILPLEEQLEIVAEVAEKLSQIEAAEVATDHSLKRAARLRQCILKRAFEGKLVLQDPTDEPAEKLLDRIRQERTESNGSVGPRTRRGRASRQQAEGETHGAAS